MPRYVRNTAVLLEIESSYGTDPTPTGGANAFLVSELRPPELNASNQDRANVRPYFGGNQQLVGTRFVTVGFDVEYAGSGTAGTAPAWDPAIKSCGFAADVQAGYVAYTPLTDTQPSCTIYWYDSGVLHSMVGCRGTVMLMMRMGEVPKLRFSFTGSYIAPTATGVPSVTLTAWQVPGVIMDANSGDVTLGGTYSAGAVSSGTAYPSTGLEIDVGNQVEFIPLLGREAVEIVAREMTLRSSLELTAAQEVTAMAAVIANTTGAWSLTHGATSGNILIAHMPAVQRINPRKGDQQGLRLIDFEGRCVPTTGNDELVLVVK